MKPIFRILTAITLAALTFGGCKNGNRKALLPNVSGKAGEVLVVIDKSDWEGAIGNFLHESLSADCPFLPQKEPLYNLVNINPSNFSQMFQIHRNIIIFNINAGVQTPGIICQYDRWSHPQIVITINAVTSEQAAEVLQNNSHTIINAIEQKERDRVVDNTRLYQERKLADVVKAFTGGNMVFPSGWSIKKSTSEFLWFSYETTYVQQGIFIYRYPALHRVEELSAEALTTRRNKILMENVPGMVDGSYMTTSDFISPAVKYVSYKNRKFAELRGLWDVHGDFMGGPFVSHTFYTPDKEELICAEAYVYAPKYDKRHYLRQAESLLYSFEWNDDEGQKTAEQ